MQTALNQPDGLFHGMPEVDIQPLEELFRARIITYRVEKGLLPPARADLVRLAQYIIRNPFAVESRAAGETGCP
ncbi:MAG: hypothetical protein WCR06_07155 [bacterium]